MGYGIEELVLEFDRRRKSGMARMGFDEMHTIPRDSVAARVVYHKGVSYEADVRSRTEKHQDVPHEMRDIGSLPFKVRNDPNFRDYTGHRFGDFTVVGMLKAEKFDKWVMRCVCGCYEIRRTYSINRGEHNFAAGRCQSCMDLARIKNRDFFNEHGRYPWQEEGSSGSVHKRNKTKRASAKFLCV